MHLTLALLSSLASFVVLLVFDLFFLIYFSKAMAGVKSLGFKGQFHTFEILHTHTHAHTYTHAHFYKYQILRANKDWIDDALHNFRQFYNSAAPSPS